MWQWLSQDAVWSVVYGEERFRTIKSTNACLCLVEIHTEVSVHSLCRILAFVLGLSSCFDVLFAWVTWLKTRSPVSDKLAGHLQSVYPVKCWQDSLVSRGSQALSGWLYRSWQHHLPHCHARRNLIAYHFTAWKRVFADPVNICSQVILTFSHKQWCWCIAYCKQVPSTLRVMQAQKHCTAQPPSVWSFTIGILKA